VGLAARYLEEKGLSTVVLTPTPEFNRAVGIPRSVAIAYPYGRPLGQVGDRNGQRRVLSAALAFLEEAGSPGEVRHLPFAWPEAPKEAKWHPPEMSPIVKYFIDQIRAARK
jgi:hypothetical protein